MASKPKPKAAPTVPTVLAMPSMARELMARIDDERQQHLNAVAAEVAALLQLDADANSIVMDYRAGTVTVTPKE